MSRKDDLEGLITKHQRHLQKLKEQQASFGLHTPAHILTEIEDTEAEVERLQTELEALPEGGAHKLSPSSRSEPGGETVSKRRVQIYLQGDFSSLTPERRSAAIDALAGIMGIPSLAIEIYGIYEASIVFDLGIPLDAVKRLRSLLQANSAQLHLLKVEKVVLEGKPGKAEEWINKEGVFELSVSTLPNTHSDPLKNFQKAENTRKFRQPQEKALPRITIPIAFPVALVVLQVCISSAFFLVAEPTWAMLYGFIFLLVGVGFAYLTDALFREKVPRSLLYKVAIVFVISYIVAGITIVYAIRTNKLPGKESEPFWEQIEKKIG